MPDSLRALRPACAAILVALSLLASGCGGGSGSGSPSALPSSRVGPATEFTPATEILANPTGTLDQLQRLGVEIVHLDLRWGTVAPDPTSRTRPAFNASDPAAYPAINWTIYDTIIRDAKARGIKVDLALWPPPPAWASGPGAPHPSVQPFWRPSAPDFEQFVRAVGTRYSGHYTPPGASSPLPRISFWSIWNEPNLGIYLAPQAIPHTHIEVSPRLYRSLVDAAWTGLHATGHGGDRILIGEVAPAGATVGFAPGLFANMAPLRFLRALYCVDANYRPLQGQAASQRSCPTRSAASASFAAAHPGLFHASGFADHPYTQGQPPDQSTPDEPDYAELPEITRLANTLDRLQRIYGSQTRFPIYSTEYGYQTTPPDQEAGTVSPAQAAVYMNWSEYLSWLDPRIRTYDQYLLTDPPAGFFATGLLFANGTPKPGYAAFRMPIFLPAQSGSRAQPLEVWGCVRPAHYAQSQTGRRQRVRIQFAPGSGGRFKTVSTVPITDRYGYFDVRLRFPGSGRVRLAWTYPHGPEVFSRTVVITLR